MIFFLAFVEISGNAQVWESMLYFQKALWKVNEDNNLQFSGHLWEIHMWV